MLNILGVTRFIDLSFQLPGTSLTIPMPLAVGVLPYPVTFLCTDFISELYGRHRANQVVWMGLALNLWVMLIFWVGGALPGFEPADQPQSGIFFEVRRLAFSAVTASMIAYLAAQFIDVQVFHFWKRLTQGRHLWLRNNGSTLVSQLVDTVAVILITHFLANGIPVDEAAPIWPQLLTFIAAGYTFKLTVALLDTVPFSWAQNTCRATLSTQYTAPGPSNHRAADPPTPTPVLALATAHWLPCRPDPLRPAAAQARGGEARRERAGKAGSLPRQANAAHSRDDTETTGGGGRAVELGPPTHPVQHPAPRKHPRRCTNRTVTPRAKHWRWRRPRHFTGTPPTCAAAEPKRGSPAPQSATKARQRGKYEGAGGRCAPPNQLNQPPKHPLRR